MRAHRRRRLLRVACLRAFRLVRHHYFSMLSAGILSGALVLALTNSALQDEPAVSAPAVIAALTPFATITPGLASPASPTPAPLSRLLIYYVVGSEEQQLKLETAVQSDAVYQARHGLVSGVPPTYRYFLLIRTPEDEREALMLINELAVLAPSEGYRLRVVDMR